MGGQAQQVQLQGQTAEQVKLPAAATVEATFGTPQIPEGTYQLTSLGPEGTDPGKHTAQQLRQGVKVQLPGMRVMLIKLEPVE